MNNKGIEISKECPFETIGAEQTIGTNDKPLIWVNADLLNLYETKKQLEGKIEGLKQDKRNQSRHIEHLEIKTQAAISFIKRVCFDNEQYCIDLKECDVETLLNILEERG